MAGDLSRLHHFITDHYDLEDLRTFCFQQGVDYDSLPGEGKAAKARELLLYAGRQGQFEQLLHAVAHERPDSFDFDLAPDAIKALYTQLPTWETRPTAAQERLLDALPLDHIPAPAPLPPRSRMPLSPNPLFVGREDDLKALAKTLKGGQTAAIGQIAAATGLGGIGKTQLASEFAHRYGQYFAGGVFWFSFADAGGIPLEIASCGGLGGLELHSDFEKLSLPDQVRLVRAAWAKPTPRLLVFDNCEDLALLTRWRPSSGGCRVLVTSRQGRWEAALGVQALALDVLYREESVDLLRKHRPNLTRDQANAIAAELGDLPLALHLAGSYLETYRDDPLLGDPVDFLAELRDAGLLDHPALRGVDVDFSPTAHALHVGRTFALSYERLDARDPTDALALALLGRAAYFAPGEAIPRDLLLTTLDLEGGDRDEARRAARGLRRLVGLGLLAQEEGGALTLHRLLAAFGQGLADEGAQQAVEKILYNEANRLNKVGYPALLLAWQPHLRAVTDAAMGREDERAARLCSALDFHLSMIGDYIGARPYSERALAIREKVLGAEHPRTASSLNNLGALLDSMGDLAGAQPYYERALAINEKVLGAEHPDTARSLNNLGTLLYSMGDLTGARSYFERVLAICEAVLGAEHPDTARSLNNLGALLYSMGDLTGARSYFERVLAIFEAALGAEHPDTAQSLNNLGYLLRAMGNLAEAQPYYERALTIREAVLGAEHPDTALSLNNMGALLVAMGDLAEARPYYERALTIREKALGAEHPDTALSLNNMGALLRATGDYESARPYFERALAICTARLGPDHPHTRMVQGNLADLDARSSQTLKVFLNL